MGNDPHGIVKKSLSRTELDGRTRIGLYSRATPHGQSQYPVSLVFLSSSSHRYMKAFQRRVRFVPCMNMTIPEVAGSARFACNYARR